MSAKGFRRLGAVTGVWGVTRVVCAVSAASVAGLAGGVTPASASVGVRSFAGSCTFSGTILPSPAITIVPHPGAHFSYLGTGTCTGTLNGAAVSGSPIAVTFTNVATAFDTCELGPDFNLHGTATIGTGDAKDVFAITINLARLAIAGPLVVTSAAGGQGFGLATFQPPDTAAAIQACAGVGVATATLAGTFSTLSALVGAADPPTMPAPAPPAAVGGHRKPGTSHHRPHRHRGRHPHRHRPHHRGRHPHGRRHRRS